jgi:AcrR family transcriptional regulator
MVERPGVDLACRIRHGSTSGFSSALEFETMNATRGNIVDVTGPLSEKQERILDAAEACFVRDGFDRTTMQDIAREAGMSSPNIYRYFSSKETLVLGLAERDGKRSAFVIEPMNEPGAGADALIEVFERYFGHLRRERAILTLDLWLEATRNPDLATIEARSDAEGHAWLVQAFTALATTPDFDPEVLIKAISPLFRGMITCRALQPGYDPAPALAQLRSLITAGLAGRLPGPPHRRKDA